MVYLCSDISYVFVYQVFGYRKKVVFQNLRNSFPEKTPAEIEEIAKGFYSYFCDLILETIRMAGMTKKEVIKRSFNSLSPEFQQVLKEGKSTIFMMGHFGNWEWASNHFTIVNYCPLLPVYKKLSNPWVEGWLYRIRKRFGAMPISMETTLRTVIERKDQQSTYAFVADQTPVPPATLWLNFLNQDTPVFTGAEKIAKKMDIPVFYVRTTRPKRGIYHYEAEVISLNPGELPEFELSRLFFQKLEEDIQKEPALWLWSHRRWKHKR